MVITKGIVVGRGRGMRVRRDDFINKRSEKEKKIQGGENGRKEKQTR
jgi:hypothetical protein